MLINAEMWIISMFLMFLKIIREVNFISTEVHGDRIHLISIKNVLFTDECHS